MNCPGCDYLLWELPENRCPECGLTHKTTDFAFPPGAVHFACRPCGQTYLGNDERGLPTPPQFDCVGCRQPIDAGDMSVRPVREGARGRHVRFGTPWEHRRDVGFLRGFVDGIARLAMQPGEYFRQCYGEGHRSGSAVFSILCAYVTTLVLYLGLRLVSALVPAALGTLSFGRSDLFFLVLLIPVATVGWNYAYGLLIQAVLFCLGQRGAGADRSVQAVAFGSAVLPALVLLPPVGLAWYVSVVASGVEHLHGVSRNRAMVASLVPVLLAANLVIVVLIAMS